MTAREDLDRDGPSDQALENFVEIVGDALERRYPDLHVIPRRPGRPSPPGSRYLPLAAKRPPSPPGERKP
jgi:hypothetical protein